MSTTDVRHSVERRGPRFELGAGFLLARLGAMAERSWGAVVRESGLRPADHAVLAVLREAEARGESLTQRSVADRVGVDPRNVVATISRLLREGRIAAASDPHDRRARRLRLTDDGRSALAALTRGLGHGRSEFFAALSGEEYDTLCDLLRRVYASRIEPARADREDPASGALDAPTSLAPAGPDPEFLGPHGG